MLSASMQILRSNRRAAAAAFVVVTWLLMGLWAGQALGVAATSPSQPQKPQNDPTGAFMTQPTAVSTPGYVGPTAGGAQNPVDALARSVSRTYYSINITWTLMAGFLVMFMQAGFALLETGLCRAKNAAHTMSMNLMVYALTMVAFFVCGFAFMCGGLNASGIGGPATLGGLPMLNKMFHIGQWGILGKTGFFLGGQSYDAAGATFFLYMMVFMDTSATIPTGALSERWRFKSFCIFSLCVGAFLYPVYGCWMWGGGWLSQLGQLGGIGHGAIDYAGSSVVHLQGGVISLVTVMLIGPRIGKYDSAGRPRPIFGHHMPMVFLGTFILAFGWFGFNAGSSLAGTTGRIGVIAVNTMLASGGGAAAACFFMWMRFGKPDPSMMCSGLLCGLVSITAGCAYVAPWAALLIGAIAGLLGCWSIFLLERKGIDDPPGAIGVHGVAGLWGILAVGLFADGTYGLGANGVHLIAQGTPTLFGWKHVAAFAGNPAEIPQGFTEIGVTGLLYGHSKQIVAQLIAGATCIAWNLLAGGLVFILLGKFLGSNRVAPEVEIAGLDIPEMGAPGYPEFITAVAPEHIPSSQIVDARARIPALTPPHLRM